MSGTNRPKGTDEDYVFTLNPAQSTVDTDGVYNSCEDAPCIVEPDMTCRGTDVLDSDGECAGDSIDNCTKTPNDVVEAVQGDFAECICTGPDLGCIAPGLTSVVIMPDDDMNLKCETNFPDIECGLPEVTTIDDNYLDGTGPSEAEQELICDARLGFQSSLERDPFQGECIRGVQTCLPNVTGGTIGWVLNDGPIFPAADTEMPNGLDYDCDGVIDEIDEGEFPIENSGVGQIIATPGEMVTGYAGESNEGLVAVCSGANSVSFVKPTQK